MSHSVDIYFTETAKKGEKWTAQATVMRHASKSRNSVLCCSVIIFKLKLLTGKGNGLVFY